MKKKVQPTCFPVQWNLSSVSLVEPSSMYWELWESLKLSSVVLLQHREMWFISSWNGKSARKPINSVLVNQIQDVIPRPTVKKYGCWQKPSRRSDLKPNWKTFNHRRKNSNWGAAVLQSSSSWHFDFVMPRALLLA
jgi:hypothetical protein